jgi:hypothetical protein
MHFSFRFAAAAVLTLAAAAASAQDNAVIYYDPTIKNEFGFCIQESRLWTNPPACPPPNTQRLPFLVQGQRSQLRVVNRKFLTQYSFYVTQVTPVANFAIEDLNEAANLTIGTALGGPSAVSKGAAPKGLATSGTLTLRTAQDLITELLNPATASNPVNEIQSDWIMIKREVENVRNDANGFSATWRAVYNSDVPGTGTAGVPFDQIACLPAYGAPTLVKTLACLRALYGQETSAPFALNLPIYGNEDEFRKLIVRDNDAIAMVSSLGATLTQQTPVLASQLSAFDGDLASLRADMNTLAGNVQAMEDALEFAINTVGNSVITRDQLKSKIIQLFASGAKPVLDDAEINVLTDELFRGVNGYETFERTWSANDILAAQGKAQMLRDLEDATELAGAQDNSDCIAPRDVRPMPTSLNGRELECLAVQIDTQYSSLLERDHKQLSNTLPTQIAAINTAQSDLLARANQIYDRSQVAIPLDLPINLSGNTGNLRLYFTIYETETFPRFAIPPITSATAPVATATPAILTAAPPTTTTTTTTATATTTTTGTPSQPTGTAVANGVVDVHDRYRATMVAAFAFSPNLKEISITSKSVTTGTASGSTTPCSTSSPCSQVTVARGSAHSSVILGMSFHPWGYDTFPHAYSARSVRDYFKNEFIHELGFFGGLSVLNFNDYYAGVDLQFAHGVQLMGGANFFREDSLAPGYTNGGIYAGTPTFTGPQHFKTGAYFGLGLNLSIFRKAFGSVTGLGTSTTTSGS